MVELNWTEEAQTWLQRIYEYIAQDDELAAARVVQGIFDKAQHLTAFPEMGHICSEEQRNVRILLYGHYRIAYLVKPDRDIDVLGVFHGSLDIQAYFDVNGI